MDPMAKKKANKTITCNVRGNVILYLVCVVWYGMSMGDNVTAVINLVGIILLLFFLLPRTKSERELIRMHTYMAGISSPSHIPGLVFVTFWPILWSI